MAIMNVLAELHQEHDLKVNLLLLIPKNTLWLYIIKIYRKKRVFGGKHYDKWVRILYIMKLNFHF